MRLQQNIDAVKHQSRLEAPAGETVAATRESFERIRAKAITTTTSTHFKNHIEKSELQSHQNLSL